MPPTGWLDIRPGPTGPLDPIPGTWRLQLEAVAEGMPPRRYEVEISWRGAWSGPPLNDELTIHDLREVRRFSTAHPAEWSAVWRVRPKRHRVMP
jgi:hypothetical protein